MIDSVILQIMKNKHIMEKIKHTKKELYICREMQEEYSQLHKSLQLLEVEIEQLEKEIQKEPRSKLSLKKEVLLEECLEKKREIDHRIDTLEDYTEEHEEELRNTLYQAILDLHPEESRTLDQLIESEEHINFGLKAMASVLEHMELINKELNQIMRTRNSIKKWSVFRYIVGQNPNLKIASCMQNIDMIAEQLLIDDLNNLKQYTQNDEHLAHLIDEIEVELKRLVNSCRERWGFKKIDTFFFEASKTFHEYGKQLQYERKKALKLFEDKKTEINTWIEKNS